MAKRSGSKVRKLRRTVTSGKWVAPRSGGCSALAHSGRGRKRSAKVGQVAPPEGRAGVSQAVKQ